MLSKYLNSPKEEAHRVEINTQLKLPICDTTCHGGLRSPGDSQYAEDGGRVLDLHAVLAVAYVIRGLVHMDATQQTGEEREKYMVHYL